MHRSDLKPASVIFILVHAIAFQYAKAFSTSFSAGRLMVSTLRASSEENYERSSSKLDRRTMFQKSIGITSAAVAASTFPEAASAMNSKSRTEGYAIQYSEREWAYILSGPQFNILRQGGTERPNTSILEGEERSGEYRCAGCSTPLFSSSAKFHSGTGWPSFATGLAGVETEDVNPVQASLLGAEIRCATCGGHLGDVFNDGKLFVNTPAFASGKRYCVDGGALIFKPADGGEDVYGDLPPPVKKSEMPAFLSPPTINARDM